MSRTIPAAMLTKYATGRTSDCKLIKVKCKDGTIIGFTTADHDIVRSFGPDGEVTYRAENSLNPSAQEWAADLSVDNAEFTGFVTDTGITEEELRAGVLDHARFWVFVIDYLADDENYWIHSAGTTGEIRFTASGFKVEFRSKSQSLKQPLAETYTLTCPVAYGSAPCGKSFAWASAEVDTPDATEPDRAFTYTDEGVDWLDAPAYTFGVIKVTSGDNTGAEVEVELHETGELTLLLPLPYPLEAGDTFDARIDCNKEARDDVHGCKSPLRWGADWIHHHRGFPDIPVARQGSLTVPGAETPSVPGSGSVTTTADE